MAHLEKSTFMRNEQSKVLQSRICKFFQTIRSLLERIFSPFMTKNEEFGEFNVFQIDQRATGEGENFP